MRLHQVPASVYVGISEKLQGVVEHWVWGLDNLQASTEHLLCMVKYFERYDLSGSAACSMTSCVNFAAPVLTDDLRTHAADSSCQ